MKFSPSLVAVLPFALSATARSTSTYVGCFSTTGSWEDFGTFTFQSIGHCVEQCSDAGYNIHDYAAVQDESCYCGDSDPAKADLLDDDECTAKCPGYAGDTCGGAKTWSVYAIGDVKDDLWADEDESSSTAGSSTSTSTEESTAVSTATSTAAEAATSTAPVEVKPASGTVSSSATPSASASSTPASSSTSIEPTPTGNSASRRYSFLF
ncbi:WSC domain-containing protein [Aspergillus mulundensis]|uniref:Putative plasma membrane sensor transducer n=1 Tax=Aspergillus mulundensis TaxID=1810919 RepID=A0A3D8QMZ0_9EURO|nr:putative plasma membrane sensor transducer [Aspergillus mulundensis]RDW63193.1 putative plasma membrane sensor transducer [Aspergillus mulundensis]